jgi:hypothetical protein
MATFRTGFLLSAFFLGTCASPLMAQQRACATLDFVSANAHALTDSYRDLVEKTPPNHFGKHRNTTFNPCKNANRRQH